MQDGFCVETVTDRAAYTIRRYKQRVNLWRCPKGCEKEQKPLAPVTTIEKGKGALEALKDIAEELERVDKIIFTNKRIGNPRVYH